MKNHEEINLSDLLKQHNISPDNVVPIRENPELDTMYPLTYDELKSAQRLPREYILHPWLPTQGIAFIYAGSGVGKTLFTLNVAYAIAQGTMFLKYSAPTPRKVLYIDGEMQFSIFLERFDLIVKQQGELTFKENFTVYTPDKAKFKLPKICTPEGQEFYSKKIKELGIEVVIFDNISTLSAIDENKSDQWKLIQDWLLDLRSKNVASIVVHHAGKEKKGYRGTSRMLDVVDTAISLQDLSGDQLESENTGAKKFRIEYQKNRSFGGKDAFAFEVTLDFGGWGFKSMEQTTTERVIDRLKLKMGHKEIAMELGYSRSYVSRIVRKAIKDGLLPLD